MCPHPPPCPTADAADGQAVRVSTACHEQGCRLCNGVVRFDTGQLVPDGQVVAPCRSDAAGRAA
ncbi:DUF5999 family protein [Streptomyces sp. NBUL23]|uniref:DUF5999 family protein n=1 Tax=Streptomyces sp. NBUL23 TaxID=3381354 RepID=UPI003871FDB0